MLETKCQIHKNSISKSEKPEEFQLKRVIDKKDLLILKFRRKKAEKKLKSKRVEYQQHNLVLLTKGFSNEDLQTKSLLAIVDSIVEPEIGLKVKLVSTSEKFSVFYELLTLNSTFYVQKICGLATIEREFVALDNMKKTALKEFLINPTKYRNHLLNEKPSYFKITRNLLERLKSEFNESQLKAIKSSLKTEGVTLIQGPPGTGKTSIVLGILSVLLSSETKLAKSGPLSQTERQRILSRNSQTVSQFYLN